MIIPARNEAAALPALLASLAQQTRRPYEIIVVDDQSEDGTAAVATAGGAMVISAGDRPSGWLGKPWACARGAAAAHGELLLFLDADTVARPAFLDALERLVAGSRGLVSVAPFHRTQAVHEQASALFNLVALMATGTSSLRRTARIVGAFGPCLAMGAADYAAIGGHEAVRGAVLEDVELARRFQQHGRPVTNVVGGELLEYRMYPEGLRQLVEGWSKNFAAGAGHTPRLRLLGVAGWMSGAIEAGWWTVATLAGAGLGALDISWAHVLFYVLFATQLRFLLGRIGRFGPAAWLHPLATAAFTLICARSLVLRRRGEVTWKGRRITAARADRHV